MNKKEKEKRINERNGKREEKGRKRRKKFLHAKNRGQIENYYNQKKGRTKKPVVMKTTKVDSTNLKKKTMLQGYKTYIMAVMALASVVIAFLGWIELETLVKLITIFLAGEVAALRHSVKKLEK